MINNYFHKGNTSFKDKFLSLDFTLMFFILLLGFISFFAMYSTEKGNFDYYTTSHIYRFSIFYLIFISISFVNIRFLSKFAYLFYFVIY